MSNFTSIQFPLPIDGETIEIPLTQGQVAIVDAIDSDLAFLKWHAQFDRHSKGFYAQRNTPKIDGKASKEMMHRIILSRILGRALLRSEQVDHIHHNTLDNRRSELRLASHAQNTCNQGIKANNTSGFKGVCWNKHLKKWQAEIYAENKHIRLGFYNDPAEAHKAYCEAAVKYFGEFARFE